MPATQQRTPSKRLGDNSNSKANNLSKMVKPAASTAERLKNERAGLLLLSAKKEQGGLLASKKQPAASKKPQPNNRSSSSTHQVLLSAVHSAGQTDTKNNPQPDAWGMAEKKAVAPVEAVVESSNIAPAAPTPSPASSKHQTEPTATGPSWEEYGGRGVATGKLVETGAPEAAVHHHHHHHRSNREVRTLWEPDSNTDGHPNNPSPPEAPPVHESSVINVQNYEDRGRGETAAPRMLFDPKSGSMVAAPSNADKPKNRRGPRKAKVLRREEKKIRAKVRKDSISSDKSEEKLPQSFKLPRTCGVLYTRNKKGALVSADDCDGDLGYGCHSVPGGRVRNAAAYQLFVQDHAGEMYESYANEADGGYGGTHQDSSMPLATGFQLEEAPPQPIEWVRADDKLELVTGDDSPTLKPTAKEWAPSQAALAAAAAAAAVALEKNGSELSVESEGQAVEVDNDDEDGHSGLGFDPMQDMDFMSSPSHLPHSTDDALASVTLQALSLEPSAFADNTATKSNIFAFGSTTWGAATAATNTNPGSVRSSDRGVLGWGNAATPGNDHGGLFGSDVFRTGGTRESGDFLPVVPHQTSSWGSSTGPIPGLNLQAKHESEGG